MFRRFAPGRRSPVAAFCTFALILAVALIVANCRRSTGTTIVGGPAHAQILLPFDQRVTDDARVLAGLEPLQKGALASVTSQAAWRGWQQEFDADWRKASNERLKRMAAWRDAELKPVLRSCGTLMYPFSGPDILNAYVLFPDCRRYVMFGLEHVGQMPDLGRLKPADLDSLLIEVRVALADLLTRNYFITSRMMSELEARELKGNIPVFAIFLARLDTRIIAIREMWIEPDGRLSPRSPKDSDVGRAPAVEIEFVRPGFPTSQTLVYFRAQIEDKALARHPGVIPYLRSTAPFASYLKSASYLLHGDLFNHVRNALLDGSTLVLEDDSGIPFRFFRERQWQVNLFGRYDKPIKDFNYGYQPDLAKAYEESKVKDLPFSFGYHWKDGASALLAVRQPGDAVKTSEERK